jgi:hypothetical protein
VEDVPGNSLIAQQARGPPLATSRTWVEMTRRGGDDMSRSNKDSSEEGWQRFAAAYQIGDVLEGTVASDLLE